MPDVRRDLLRHFLATLAYRFRKAVHGAPADFGSYPGAGKSPAAIVSHMGDLLEWALSWFSEQRWNQAKSENWDESVARFFSLLQELDKTLASGATLRHHNEERMLQGPLADAMTHVGQLAMLRRLAGAATKAENFAEAKIAVGDLSAPKG